MFGKLFSNSPNILLTDIQQRAYTSEQEDNFRWIAYLASRPVERLSDPFKDTAIYHFIAQIGQYCEMAHGSIPIQFVFDHVKALSQPQYPLYGYDALINDEPDLVDHFKGSLTQLQGYVAFRPHVGQLVAAISGTSQPEHALNDLDFRLVPPYHEGDGTPETYNMYYPLRGALEFFRKVSSQSLDGEGRMKVHAGFWRMYLDLRASAMQAVMAGLEKYREHITEIVATGHSMGGSLSYFLMMDIMKDMRESGEMRRIIGQRRPPKLRLVVFGAPRVGNEALSEHWTQCITEYRDGDEDMFQEYSLKTNEDGAHILPPHFLGYRHLTQSPLYLFKGNLYRVPPAYKECGAFLVESPSTSTDAVTPMSESDAIGIDLHRFSWPLGGHNYYFRDMESLRRRLRWLELSSEGETGWEARYKDKLEEWEKKYPPIIHVDSPSSSVGSQMVANPKH